MLIPWKLLVWARKNGVASITRRGLFGLEVQFGPPPVTPDGQPAFEPPEGLSKEAREIEEQRSRDALDFHSA